MIYKNVIFYRFTKAFSITEDELDAKLKENVFTACGAQDITRQGWYAPLGKRGTQLIHTTDSRMMICLKREDRILPASVLNEAVAEKVEQIEENEDRKVSKKEKEQIKEEISHDLLPKAFTKSKCTYAYIDIKSQLMIVNAGNHKAAEEITSFLRKTIGSLPLAIPKTKQAPAAIMTNWLTDSASVPAGITVDCECELRDLGEEGGVVRFKDVELEGEEVTSHLDAGKQAVMLAVTKKDDDEKSISFKLNADLSIKGLKFGDLLKDDISDSYGEKPDAATRFDASFAIFGAEIESLIPFILESFGGEEAIETVTS